MQMTIRASSNDGLTWPSSLLVYLGPAGYSQLATLTNGDIILLYEQGRIEYSERISFARIEVQAL